MDLCVFLLAETLDGVGWDLGGPGPVRQSWTFFALEGGKAHFNVEVRKGCRNKSLVYWCGNLALHFIYK